MTSKYKEIYEDIKKSILNGKLKSNERIKSENELVKDYLCSRDTVRKALTMLETDGLIYKVKGKGSFVFKSSDTFDFPISGLKSFSEISKEIKKNTVTKVVEFKDNIENIYNNEFDIHGEDVYYISAKRLRIINDEKVILDRDVLRKDLAVGMDLSIFKKSIFSFIEKVLELKIGFARKEITVIKTDEDDRKFLELDKNDYVVAVKTYIYLEDGRMFQFTESHHRVDKFRFVDTAKRI